MNRKRTVVLVACMVVVLAFPALAYALRRTYFGPAAGGVNNAGVEFSARLKHGKPVKITRFEWHNVTGSCGGARLGATTGEFPSSITVSGGAFSATGHLNSGRETVKVSGTFKHHNTRMAGHLRVTGTVAGCGKIDTTTVSWSAKQPAGQP